MSVKNEREPDNPKAISFLALYFPLSHSLIILSFLIFAPSLFNFLFPFFTAIFFYFHFFHFSSSIYVLLILLHILLLYKYISLFLSLFCHTHTHTHTHTHSNSQMHITFHRRILLSIHSTAILTSGLSTQSYPIHI